MGTYEKMCHQTELKLGNLKNTRENIEILFDFVEENQ